MTPAVDPSVDLIVANAPIGRALGAPDGSWLRANQTRLADPLAFVAAIEALRADPACVPCRRDLRALLWPLLPRPAATVPRRDDGGDAGRRYLDALRQEDAR